MDNKDDAKNGKDDYNGNSALAPNMMNQVPNLIDENEDITNIQKTCLICNAQVIHLSKHMKVHTEDISEQCIKLILLIWSTIASSFNWV